MRHLSYFFIYLSLLILLGACGDVKFSKPSEASDESHCADESCNGTYSVHETLYVTVTNKIDILFVVDTSGSMKKERTQLGSRLANFISGLGALDWQICVTTTDPYKEAGRLLSFGGSAGKVLTAATSDYNNLFLDLVTNVPSGTGDEQGIHSLGLALDRHEANCFRDDAALASIVISDEDERSTGGYPEFIDDDQYEPLEDVNLPQTLVDQVDTVLGNQKKFTSHSIVVPSDSPSCYATQQSEGVPVYYGRRYEELSKLTGGVIGNVCASDYAEQLEKFADSIRQSLDSVTLKCVPIGAPKVTLTPQPAGVEVSSQGNKVYFKPGAPAGTQVDVSYDCPVTI